MRRRPLVCPRCGGPLQKEDSFCGNCGSLQQESTQSSAPFPQDTDTSDKRPFETHQSAWIPHHLEKQSWTHRRRGILLILLCLISLLIGGGVTWLIARWQAPVAPSIVATPTHVVTSTPTVIHTAVGGCRENRGGPANSFEMGVCISDRGSNAIAIFPDVYVNQYPSEQSNCILYIEIWDNTGNKLSQDGGHSCTQSHSESPPFSLSGMGGLLHSSVWMSYNGAFYRMGDSPSYYYSENAAK